MKSERRHELQHNALADWLAKSAESIKPYQNLLFAAVVVVLVAAVGYTLWSRESAAQTTRAWDEVNTAVESGNPPQLVKVIENYPNSNVAHMAAVVLADFYLAEGCDRLFTNKATAQQELTKAIELYQAILEQSRVPTLLERATFGLARARESKGTVDEIKQAEKLYEEVAANWPNGAYTAAATQRRKDLERPATKVLYDDFRRFDPKPAFSSEPGERPSFDLNSVPSEGPAPTVQTTGDLKLDGKATDEKKAAGEKKEAEEKTPDETGKK
jgi:predicted negative regulator of RcsB-dependent stress response